MPARTRSLTPAAVLDHVRQHCFTPTGPTGQVGVEVELLTTKPADAGRRPTATELFALIERLPMPAGGRLTVEPGGQIELSSRPHAGAGPAIDATSADLDALRCALQTAGIQTTALGLDPSRRPERVVPGPRYDAMEAYFAGDGDTGLAMMCGTASVQVNLDLGDADALSRRWRAAHTIGPVLIAAFANSPLAAGRPAGARNGRQRIWNTLDRTRTAPASTGLAPPDAWARYALAARVMLVRAGPEDFRPVGNRMSFARWMADGHELGYPTLDDFAYHLTTLFPPVRPKGWLELRVIDAVPDPWWQVAVAVTTALLDDPEALDVADRACRPVAGAWAEAAVSGLGHPGLAAAATTCFTAALAALPRLGVGPEVVAAGEEFVDRYVSRRRCPGDDVLDAWRAGRGPLAAAGITPGASR